MASAPWKHPSVLRAIAVAGPGSLASLAGSMEQDLSLSPAVDRESSLRDSTHYANNNVAVAAVEKLRKIWSPAIAQMEALPSLASSNHSATEFDSSFVRTAAVAVDAKEYDFVVIGHGIAGKSAVKTLQELCPEASIAVVDPNINAKTQPNNGNGNDKIELYGSLCEGFDPSSRCVRLSANGKELRYKHSILVTTGSRGAPPPHYLFDEKALGRIMELRPTLLPQPSAGASQTSGRKGRPIWDPTRVRQTVLQAARKGERVAVLGSGWDAVELAIACSAAHAQSKRRKSSVATTMVFGSKGPLSHVAPQYLSAAIAKRLTSEKHKIELFHRSLIRYVGPDKPYNEENVEGSSRNDNQHGIQCKGLQLYTAKSYDLLDGTRTDVHWLVVAPEISGPMGTATLPTTSGPSYLESAREGRVWYQTWSQLLASDNSSSPQGRASHSNNNSLACYADDGRIVVNAELSAGNGVYAAGSVAKYPNPLTGSADVAGVGMEEGTEAGMVAGSNMARDFYQHSSNQHSSSLFGFGGNKKGSETYQHISHLKHPIPVWRSDQTRHSAGCKRDGLKDAGIYALYVGTCDSERFSTQAFWWTNQSKRLKEWLDDDTVGSNNSTTQNPRRRRTKRLGKNPASSLKPVYGRGIIYYMDQDSGHIQGVMIWGLPFTENDGSEALNSKLVQQMQKIIQTNGGFRNLGQDSEMERVQFVDFLAQSSRQMVVKALSPFSSQIIAPEVLPRPLIRYTEVRPAGMRRVRVLNRKQEARGHGFLGEDLFSRSGSIEEMPPGSLPDFDNLRELDTNEIFYEPKFAKDVSREDRTAARKARAKALQDWVIWDWYQSRWEENEERARPPKEEHLWLRKGDEDRGVSSKDKFNESLIKAIFPDGR